MLNNHERTNVRGQLRDKQDHRVNGLIYLKAVTAIVRFNRGALGVMGVDILYAARKIIFNPRIAEHTDIVPEGGDD